MAKLVLMMAQASGTFEDYLNSMSANRAWIDASFVHALGCAFQVDVCIFQAGMEPALVGCSLAGDSQLVATSLVPMMMVNDLHFWGLVDIELNIQSQHSEGDWAAGIARSLELVQRKRKASTGDVGIIDGDADDEELLPLRAVDRLDLTPWQIADVEVETELKLCQCLQSWCPWDAPTQDLVCMCVFCDQSLIVKVTHPIVMVL